MRQPFLTNAVSNLIQITRGMRVFILVWFGQLISITGSELMGFALGVWVYQRTGSVTHFTLIYVFTLLPSVLMSPIAGVLADRWSRRWVMILSDAGAALSTLAIALLFLADTLEIWHIYLLVGISSIFNGFQWPAFTAATTLLVPKEQLGRASGMVQFNEAVAQLVAPVLGAVLLVTIQLPGVILLDFATFLFAVLTLLLVRFPELKTTAVKKAKKEPLLREIAIGWHYLTERRGLLSLLIFFTANNFLVGIVMILATPLGLSFSTVMVVGTMLSIGGIGMVAGSLVMTTWGGPNRLIYAVFGFQLLEGVCILMAGWHTIIPLLTVSVFLFLFSEPFIEGYSRVIWQRKIAPEMQGRVFAMVRLITWLALPLGFLVAGPLAEYVFEPLMADNGYLADSVGHIIGTGQGRGIGLLFIIMGILTIVATVVAFQYPRLRRVEEELPDMLDDINIKPFNDTL